MGRLKLAGLALPDLDFTEHNSAVANALLQPYRDELERQRSVPPPRGSVQAAKDRLTQLGLPIRQAGMHLPPNESIMLNRQHIDGYWNVGISSMHVRKALYAGFLQCHLGHVKAATDSTAHWLNLRRRIAAFQLDVAATYSTVTNRVLDTVLNYTKPNAPPKVSGKSKSYLGNV